MNNYNNHDEGYYNIFCKQPKKALFVFSYLKIMANLFSYSTHVFFTYCLCFETFSASTLYCAAMHTKHHEVSVDIRLDCRIFACSSTLIDFTSFY